MQENDWRGSGRLGRDPELHTLPNGSKKVEMSIACSKSRKKDGAWIEKTTWVPVTIWGDTSNRVMEKCKKGTEVYVKGSLEMDEWQDRNSGKKRTKLYVTAFSVQVTKDGRDFKPQAQDGGGQMDAGDHAQRVAGQFGGREFPKKKGQTEDNLEPFSLDDAPF